MSKLVFILECSYDSLIEDPFFVFETDSNFAHLSLQVGDEFALYDYDAKSPFNFTEELENTSQQKLDDAWRKRVLIKAKHHSIIRNDYALTHIIRLALEIKIV